MAQDEVGVIELQITEYLERCMISSPALRIADVRLHLISQLRASELTVDITYV